MINDDPWKHRSKLMTCSTCMYFVPKVRDPGPSSEVNTIARLGRCRRHSPLAAGGGWPAVFETDWCGDHKLDENKV